MLSNVALEWRIISNYLQAWLVGAEFGVSWKGLRRGIRRRSLVALRDVQRMFSMPLPSACTVRTPPLPSGATRALLRWLRHIFVDTLR